MNRRTFLRSLLTGAVALGSLTIAPNIPGAYAQDAKDIVDTAVGAGSFKTLVAANARRGT